MHPNQQRIETFYTAFARLDAGAMADCYADDAQFDDEVFSLRGKREVTGLWRMLCEASQIGENGCRDDGFRATSAPRTPTAPPAFSSAPAPHGPCSGGWRDGRPRGR